MSIDQEQLNEIHSNVHANRIEFPQELQFPEELGITAQDTKIPTERYTSPDVLSEEFEKVWMATWQLACREEEVANVGDYHEYVIGRQSYLIVRGEDGVLRAFQNTCRHRGKLIRTGSGNSDELRCGYHYWCWGLDGSLKDIPNKQWFPGADEDDLDLGEILCDVFGGFVFLNPDPHGPTLVDYLGPIVEQLTPYHLENLRATMHTVVELPCNWKVVLEAFIETYHVQGIHPQIMPYIDDFNTKFQVMGDHTRMIVPFGVPSMRLEHIDQAEVYEQYHTVAGKVATRDKKTPPPPPQKLTFPPEHFDDNGEWIGPGTVRDHLIEETRKRGKILGHDYSGLVEAQLVDDYHYHIFPSMAFNLHAGAMLLFRARPHATDPDRCWFDIYTLRVPDLNEPMPEPAPTEHLSIDTTSFGLVLDQDFDNIGEVQQGLHGRAVTEVTVGASEIRIINFYRTLLRYAQKDPSMTKKM
ncbi:aromatic ring-hydroxylating oxygenase subunit alpha [Dietzia lutea]|uniref:Rieske domain-containing protein n=1 Tax=Dietzia lutea TaxID=546160 RepID=A0A2S1RA21_9ACTN|nr:aromatic ring-hydroxylating dioxygenase subunit alpha [Dietzia lutea]AWH93065.1 hypothetical protein A6035_13805 [Dietzia lutea]AWH93105.1 hypothetical protein A6035_14020 [Dietzia lutea]